MAVELRQATAAFKKAEAARSSLMGQLTTAQHRVTVLVREQQQAAVQLRQQVGFGTAQGKIAAPASHTCVVRMRVCVCVCVCVYVCVCVCAFTKPAWILGW